MNKYKNWHDNIIQRAVSRDWTKQTAPCYGEKHHIIPKCLGGSNSKENIVFLTAKEHYMVHLLLTKIHKDSNGKIKKSIYAAFKVVAGTYTDDGETYNTRKRTSRMYKSFREEITKMYSGKNNPMFGKKLSDQHKDAVRKANKGKIVSEETRKRMSVVFSQRRYSEETKEKNRQWHLGRKQSQETIQKRINTRKLNGKGQTDHQKESVSKAQSAKWLITDPKGKTFEVINVAKFCRENNLGWSAMCYNQFKIERNRTITLTNLAKGYACKRISEKGNCADLC